MKVLSIDFDYIMYPCIKLYNNLCDGKENPTVTWNMIEQERGVEKFLCYDANALMEIAKVIKRNIKNGAKLIPINDHDEIIQYLENEKNIELLNIDYHHDIIYHSEDINSLADFGKYDCGNWVGYLQLNNFLKEYTWLKAPSSNLCTIDLPNFQYKILGLKDFNSISDDYDCVFFCLSPQWVPYKYYHLYQLIISLAQ